MQSCSITGNIYRINKDQASGKTYLTVMDTVRTKGADGKVKVKTNFVPLEGMLPETLSLHVGQCVAVKFRISSFAKKNEKTADGRPIYTTANDIIAIDATLGERDFTPKPAGNDAQPATGDGIQDEPAPKAEPKRRTRKSTKKTED